MLCLSKGDNILRIPREIEQGLWGGDPGAVVKIACLESREIADSKPALAFKLRNESILRGASVTEK